MNVSFNDNLDILDLYYKVRRIAIDHYNCDKNKKKEYNISFKYKGNNILLTLILDEKRSDKQGSADIHKKIIIIYTDITDVNFSSIFFHELQHCLLDIKELIEPIYSKMYLNKDATDLILDNTNNSKEFFKKYKRVDPTINDAYSLKFGANMEIHMHIQLLFYLFTPLEIIANKDSIINNIITGKNNGISFNKIKENILGIIKSKLNTLKNYLDDSQNNAIVFYILLAMYFEYTIYLKSGLTTFFPKKLYNKPQIIKWFENIPNYNNEKYLLELIDKIVENSNLNKSFRTYVYKRFLFLAEKMEKMYTKLIENIWYQMSVVPYTDLKNKEFLTLYNEDTKLYKFETYILDRNLQILHIILASAPNFNSYIDLVTLYNNYIKTSTDNIVYSPYSYNKKLLDYNHIWTKYKSSILYIFNEFLFNKAKDNRRNIIDISDIFENLYELITNISLDEFKLYIISVNRYNEQIIDEFLLMIDEIKKEFPNIKFKYL